MFSCKVQLKVEEQKRELEHYDLNSQENDNALQALVKLRRKNEPLESKVAQLRKDVHHGTFASSSTEGNVQSMQEEVDALNSKLINLTAEVVAVCLGVEVIQMSLSSAETTLENKNADLVRCQAQIGKLT